MNISFFKSSCDLIQISTKNTHCLMFDLISQFKTKIGCSNICPLSNTNEFSYTFTIMYFSFLQLFKLTTRLISCQDKGTYQNTKAVCNSTPVVILEFFLFRHDLKLRQAEMRNKTSNRHLWFTAGLQLVNKVSRVRVLLNVYYPLITSVKQYQWVMEGCLCHCIHACMRMSKSLHELQNTLTTPTS